jgi:hypothetical protein
MGGMRLMGFLEHSKFQSPKPIARLTLSLNAIDEFTKP